MALSEQLADRLTGGKLTEQAARIADLEMTNRETAVSLAMVQESMQRLEQALLSPEWRMLSMQGQQEFTRQGLALIIETSRLMRLKNPLIKRGVKIQRLYVWAQGVSIAAVDDLINEAVQAFLDDERNRADLTGHQARGERETDLQTDGNLFFRLHINSLNGRIRVSIVDPLEIDDIICNPEDRREPWFYKRTYSQTGLNGEASSHVEYYPDWRFTPRSMTGFTQMLAAGGGLGGRIVWDTPVYHVAVNRFGKWGVSEFYDANDWALAYKSFLEQLASVWSALARWAAKLTTKGGARGVAAAKTKLTTTLASGQETNPPPVTGSTFIASEGVDLQPFRTAGATMSADDGRRLQLMAAMSFGFPETFWGDAKAGSLATAKSLDRPTELQIVDRQTLWRDIYGDILKFVLLWAVKAPQGTLRGAGRLMKEADGEQVREWIDWGSHDPTINIIFPPVIEHDIRETVSALVDAQTLGGHRSGEGIPLETAVSQMLVALGIQNVDAVLDIWREEQEARAARAEELAAQFAANTNEEPDEEPDEATMETARQRLLTAVAELLPVLEANGHE